MTIGGRHHGRRSRRFAAGGSGRSAISPALPPPDLAARLGAKGPRLQALARGEDAGPLVPLAPDERFEATLALEWPIDGLEPLSFVLGRLADPVCADLDRRGRAAAAMLYVELRLVTRDIWVAAARSCRRPSRIRARSARWRCSTWNRIRRRRPSTPSRSGSSPRRRRTLQHSLLERARPAPEQVSTLVARLSALMGEAACRLAVPASTPIARMRCEWRGSRATTPERSGLRATDYGRRRPRPALRRLRQPVVATVTVEDGRPVRVRVSRPDLPDGCIETCAGPWRIVGRVVGRDVWDRDEWDVALDDGAVCRLFRDRRKDRWFVDGVSTDRYCPDHAAGQD